MLSMYWTVQQLEDSNEDTKGVVRNRISKKDIQYDDNKKKDTQRSTTHKAQDRATRTPLITGGELRCHRMVGSPFSTIGYRSLYNSQKVYYYSTDSIRNPIVVKNITNMLKAPYVPSLLANVLQKVVNHRFYD